MALMQSLGGIVEVVTNEHASLNTSKGVIYLDDLRDLSETEILDGLKHYKVTDVYKIKKNINGELVNTALCILTFKSSSISDTIKVGFHHVVVDQYILNPMKCLNCFKYGNTKQYCRFVFSMTSFKWPPRNTRSACNVCFCDLRIEHRRSRSSTSFTLNTTHTNEKRKREVR